MLDCSTRRRLREKKRAYRGAAAVEFALIAPLFLLLLAGVIEFGQAFRIEHMLSMATRRAARSAIVTGSTSADVSQKAKAWISQTLNVAETDVTVEIFLNQNSNIDLSEGEEGDEISVTISIPYSKAGAGFYANMMSNSILSSSCILEHE